MFGETGRIRVGISGGRNTYFQPRVPGLIQGLSRTLSGRAAVAKCKATLLTWSRLCGTVRLTVCLRHGPPLGDGEGPHSSIRSSGKPMRIVLPSNAPASPRALGVARHLGRMKTFIYFSPGQSGPVLHDSITCKLPDVSGFSPILGQEAPQISSIVHLVAGQGSGVIDRATLDRTDPCRSALSTFQ